MGLFFFAIAMEQVFVLEFSGVKFFIFVSKVWGHFTPKERQFTAKKKAVWVSVVTLDMTKKKRSETIFFFYFLLKNILRQSVKRKKKKSLKNIKV